MKVTFPLKPNEQGLSQETSVEGAYEFREYRTTLSDQQEPMFNNLMQLTSMAGFTVQYSATPSLITARSGQTWILINVGDDSYNITAVRDSQVSCAPPHNAEEIAREMQARNRAELYGIKFSPENQIIEDKSSGTLNSLLKYVTENPDHPLVIESHNFSSKGTDLDDLEITRERANAIVDWLVNHGVPPAILQAKPFGRMRPLAGADGAAQTDCNDRIELSRSGKTSS